MLTPHLIIINDIVLCCICTMYFVLLFHWAVTDKHIRWSWIHCLNIVIVYYVYRGCAAVAVVISLALHISPAVDTGADYIAIIMLSFEAVLSWPLVLILTWLHWSSHVTWILCVDVWYCVGKGERVDACTYRASHEIIDFWMDHGFGSVWFHNGGFWISFSGAGAVTIIRTAC